MGLEIITLVLGPLQNNTYLLRDPATERCAVIDPSFDSQEVLAEIDRRSLKLEMILLTHAHFDHIYGVNEITAKISGVSVGLHPADLPLWRQGGGSELFGLKFTPTEQPSIHFYNNQHLTLGGEKLEVKHTPGHSRGHVIFHYAPDKIVFCGDLIFQGNIGRTDLPGGSMQELLHSIRTQVLTLPPETRLYSGHGPSTTVGKESETNSYLA